MNRAEPPATRPPAEAAAPARIDPIRPTDEGARALAQALLRGSASGALATLGEEGWPLSSLVSVATRPCGTPLILISRLSGHTGHLLARPRASLLLARHGKGDPLAHPRMSLAVEARVLARDSADGAAARRRFLARQPKAELYVDFPDFLLVALEIRGASLNGGFGKAFELGPDDLLVPLDGAEELIEAEAGAVAHMNEDHADAVRLYATALAGQEDGPWRLAGLDPAGMDLVLGQAAVRVPFPRRVVTAGDLRAVLVEMAKAARG
jgi:hypothetical protein